LFAEASELTGIVCKSEIVRHALQALIQRHAALQLAAMGGKFPNMRHVPRRKFGPNGEMYKSSEEDLL